MKITRDNHAVLNLPRRVIIAFGASLGFISSIAPHFITQGFSITESDQLGFSLVHFISNAFLSGNFYLHLLSFFVVGLMLGVLRPQDWFINGLSVIAPIPIFALMDSIFNRGTHNLFFLEIIMYAFIAVPSVIGA